MYLILLKENWDIHLRLSVITHSNHFSWIQKIVILGYFNNNLMEGIIGYIQQKKHNAKCQP